MYYRQLRAGVNDKNYQLVPADQSQVQLCLENPSQDFYTSLYKYSEPQYQQFLKTGSIKGISDVVTNWLVFDFDSKEDLNLARQDAKEICLRLGNSGVHPNAMRISYSGSKGYHVEVRLTEDITVDEFKAITKQLASGLKTFDQLICDYARPFRVLGSVNLKTGLYKIPLHFDELAYTNIEEIKDLAKNQKIFEQEPIQYETIDLPPALQELKKFKEEYKPKTENIETGELDWSKKPKWLSNCKYSLQNGYFGEGLRNSAFLCLASVYKNQGFNIEHTYRFLKGVAECQSKVNNCERYPDDLLWNNIIHQVYGDGWKNGTSTCKDKSSWLYDYCQSLGNHKCNHKDDECFIEIEDFANKFTNFATNIDKNKLKIGIPDIDERVMITTSMLVGLLGAPSAGKTTLLLNFLEESNKNCIPSVFFSMDMGLPLVYLRLIQKFFGYDKNEVFDIFLNDKRKREEIIATIKDTYKYTKFSFRTGLNTEAMKNAVLDHQEKIGQKVKLAGIDYLECISGPYSEPVANAGLIANQCKDIANDLETCVMLLLQTQKHSGDPSDPLLSMRNVKGSSVIEQACAVILSLSRPGFSPLTPEDDKFATISTVKDRMGSLMSIDCGWNGLRGSFSKLNEEDLQLLNDVKNRKKEQDKEKKDTGGW